MKAANLKTRDVEVIPAVLVKTRDALLESIKKVSPYVKTIHIDVMDNKFVPNLTVGLNELKNMPENVQYEFHWMVKNPEQWIKGIMGGHIHLVHVETIDGNWDAVKKAVKEAGGTLGLAINPETPLEKILPYAKGAERILVMSVHPGFSGQKYIKEVEEKISFLRREFPQLNIEVDGGINAETVASAIKAGVDKIAAASAIFNAGDVGAAIEKLKKIAGDANAH